MQCQLSDGAYLAQWALTGGSLPRESGEGDWKFGHNKFPVWEGEDLLRTTLPSDEIPQIFTSNLKHLICISFQHGEERSSFLCEGSWRTLWGISMEEWCITCFLAVFSFLHLLSVSISILIMFWLKTHLWYWWGLPQFVSFTPNMMMLSKERSPSPLGKKTVFMWLLLLGFWEVLLLNNSSNSDSTGVLQTYVNIREKATLFPLPFCHQDLWFGCKNHVDDERNHN